MASQDLLVKVGEYQQNGETKARWRKVGRIVDSDKGPFMLLDKTFNPAGVPDTRESDSILITMRPTDQDNGQRSQQFQDVPF